MPQSNGPKNPAISVVVPVRNEAGNVAPLVAEIAAALQGRVFEIVYVDDVQDATAEIARRWRSTRRQIRHAQSWEGGSPECRRRRP